jgi:hypothetical protein
MKNDKSDPVIDEIREIRHRISERFHHDPARLVEYYLALQEAFRDRLVRPPSPEEEGAAPTQGGKE